MFSFIRRNHNTPKASRAWQQRFRPRVQTLEDRLAPSTVRLVVHSDLNDPTKKGTFGYAYVNHQDGATIFITKSTPIIHIGDALVVNDTLTIEAAQASSRAKVSRASFGPQADPRFLEVGASGNVTLSGLDISGFNGTDPNLPAYDGEGGAILNFGTLTLDNCDVHGNIASLDGGAITNYGRLILNDCSIQYNAAGDGINRGSGGGIANFGTMTVTHSTIADNIANGVLLKSGFDTTRPEFFSVGGLGGGISNSGEATVTSTTLHDNSARAPFVPGATVLTPPSGGGIYNVGSMSVIGSVVFVNAAGLGGGIDNEAPQESLSIGTTDFSGGNSLDNIFGPYVDLGGNKGL
jgi:hypothetical protein